MPRPPGNLILHLMNARAARKRVELPGLKSKISQTLQPALDRCQAMAPPLHIGGFLLQQFENPWGWDLAPIVKSQYFFDVYKGDSQASRAHDQFYAFEVGVIVVAVP